MCQLKRDMAALHRMSTGDSFGSHVLEDDELSTDPVPGRDSLYLFGCHLLWHHEGNVKAYQELVAALDDPDPDIRVVAESLLYRSSPRRDKLKNAVDNTG